MKCITVCLAPCIEELILTSSATVRPRISNRRRQPPSPMITKYGMSEGRTSVLLHTIPTSDEVFIGRDQRPCKSYSGMQPAIDEVLR